MVPRAICGDSRGGKFARVRNGPGERWAARGQGTLAYVEWRTLRCRLIRRTERVHIDGTVKRSSAAAPAAAATRP